MGIDQLHISLFLDILGTHRIQHSAMPTLFFFIFLLHTIHATSFIFLYYYYPLLFLSLNTLLYITGLGTESFFFLFDISVIYLFLYLSFSLGYSSTSGFVGLASSIVTGLRRSNSVKYDGYSFNSASDFMTVYLQFVTIDDDVAVDRVPQQVLIAYFIVCLHSFLSLFTHNI